MGRMYSAVFEGVAVSALQDFFEINCPSDAIVVLHSCTITQSSEEADAQAEMLSVVIQQGATTSGSGGSGPTAIPTQLGDAAFGGSVEVNNTTEATAGTIVNKHRESFNVQIGFFYRPTPEERLIMSPGTRLTITLMEAPADSITMDGVVYFEEIGG